jgi:NAD(P)-dependent dehydrogenase (short-subunit alcohol dehydrogenase family)
VDGRVALFTGAARGIGRATAVRLAEEGADIIAVDIAEDIPDTQRVYRGATEADLAETAALVDKLDRRVVARKVDVRDFAALSAAAADGVAELGPLDTVCVASYVAAKHGVTGLMRTLARELGGEGIRVNSVHPCTAATPMVLNEAAFNLRHPAPGTPGPRLRGQWPSGLPGDSSMTGWAASPTSWPGWECATATGLRSSPTTTPGCSRCSSPPCGWVRCSYR